MPEALPSPGGDAPQIPRRAPQELLKVMRSKNPLVQCMLTPVSLDITCNVLLAAGAALWDGWRPRGWIFVRGALATALLVSGVLVLPATIPVLPPKGVEAYFEALGENPEIEVGDGTRRVLGPGEILLAEDTTGQGHISRAVDGEPRSCLFIPLADP